MKKLTTYVAVALSVGLIIGIWRELNIDFGPSAPQEYEAITTLFPAKGLPDMPFLNQNGQLVTKSDLLGKWHLFFIGYSNCPDICPITLGLMQKAMPQLAEANIDFIFVTADPKRDTPDTLRQYLAGFDKSFQGLTGDNQTMKALIEALGVYVTTNDDGTIDHQGVLFISNEEGEIIAILNQPQDADVIVRDVSRLIQQSSV